MGISPIVGFFSGNAPDNTHTAVLTNTSVTFRPRRTSWLPYAVLLCGIGAVCASAYIVITTYSPLPHWDEWAFFDHLATSKAWSLHWEWSQHNEHRFLVPKLFFLADVQFFHGTQKFLLVSIFGIQLFHVALLSCSLRALGGLRGAGWLTGTGLIAYCLLCPTQQENLTWGMELNFVLPGAMATLSVFSLLLYYRSRRSWLFALSITAATIATWSLSSGILIWPLLLLSVLWLRMKWTAAATLFGCAAANIAVYLYHYQRPSPENGPFTMAALEQSLKYFIVYFGSTWVRHSSGGMALVAGAVGLCASLMAIVRVVRQRTSSLLLVELVLLMLFCMATAAVTSIGRFHLGSEEASASRYQAFALLFWSSLGLSILLYASRRQRWLQSYSAVLLAIMVGFATQVRLPLIDAQWHQLQLKRISLALITGVHDPTVLADAYPAPEVVLRDAEYMKQHRLSIFHEDTYQLLGKKLESVYRVVAQNQCSGFVSSSQVLPANSGDGLRLTGYAWDRELQRPARDIFATADGRISGLGTSVTIPLRPGSAGPYAEPSRFGWIAFVLKSGPHARIELYALVGKSQGAACPFAEIAP